jgi:hypothetical protein
MGAFDHLKKDLTKLTKWPGKRDGETYAQTKARLKETPSLEAALRQAPAEYWGLTQEAILEAFAPKPDSGPMFETYVRRLERLAKDRFVDPEAAADLLLSEGGYDGVNAVLRMVTAGVIPRERGVNTALEVIRASTALPESSANPFFRELRAVRLAYPDLLTDEDVLKFAGEYAPYLHSTDGFPLKSWDDNKRMEAGLSLLRTLPNWRDMKAVAQVHGS